MTVTPGSAELLALADTIERNAEVAAPLDEASCLLRNKRTIVTALRLAAKPAEEGWTFAKLLSNALLKIRPLGGSELFVKRNGDYYADPEYCGRLIEEMRDALHQARIDKVRLEKSLSTTGTPKP